MPRKPRTPNHLNLPLLSANATIARFFKRTALLHERLAHDVAVIIIACTRQLQTQRANQGRGSKIRTDQAKPTHANARLEYITVVVFLKGNVCQQLLLRNLVFCNTHLRQNVTTLN
jgi:hypothetical protein